MAIGAQFPNDRADILVAEARADASLMPDLLMQARNVANNIISGWHGRRKNGSGENFWQFRPYVEGEQVSQIDWRRSARDDHTYLRDREWDSAQTVSIWADQSSSMHYRSRFAQTSKGNRALTLALILGDLFVRSNERVAIPGLMTPTISRHASERMALALMNYKAEQSMPDFSQLSRFSHMVIISDFLDEFDILKNKLAVLSSKQISVHLIEVADPAEESFPYSGRTEFLDPETGNNLLAGKAENYRDAYRKIYFARQEELARFSMKNGWSYHISKTDKPVSETILSLANILGSTPGYRSL